MAAACGPTLTPPVAQPFSSPCPPRSRRTHSLRSRSHMAANLRFPYGLSHTFSTRQSTPFGPGRIRLTNEGSPASCFHTLRRRELRGPVRPILRIIRTCSSIAEMGIL
jgi:hypothetical protein